MEQNILEERKRLLKEFIYLPLFYMIPYEIAERRNLHRFPRNPYVVATDPHWREVYYSKWFQVQILDTWGWILIPNKKKDKCFHVPCGTCAL